MSAIRKTLTAAAAGAALLISAVAVAAPASVSTELNMRTGPGTAYPVVQVLPRGAQVDANCAAGAAWCQVNYYGVPGWVSSRYLTTYGAPQTAYYPPTYTPPYNPPAYTPPYNPPAYTPPYNPPAYNPPAYNPPAYTPPRTGQGLLGNLDPAILGLGAAVLGGVLGNTFGGGGDDDDDNDANRRRDRDRDRVARGSACFYEDSNFGGGQFCLSEGDGDRELGRGWNDRISSVRLARGVQVQLCEDDNFDGRCITLNDDARRLSGLNDEVTSIRVR